MKTIKVDNRLLSADVVVDNIAYACDYGQQYYAVLSNGQTVVITAEDYAKIVGAGMFVEVGEGFRTTQLNVSKINFVDDDEAVLVGGVTLNLDEEARETVKSAIAAYGGGGEGGQGMEQVVLIYFAEANVIVDEAYQGVTMQKIKSLIEDKTKFVYLKDDAVLCLPSLNFYGDAIEFTGTYVLNGYTTTARVIINSDDEVSEYHLTSEKTENKVQTMDNPSADTYPSTAAVKEYVTAAKGAILYYDPANDTIKDENGVDYSYTNSLKNLFQKNPLVILSMRHDNQTALLWPNVRWYDGDFYEVQWNGYSYAEGETDTIKSIISVKVDWDDNIIFSETPYTPLKAWSGTQDAYDALATKDLVSTLYLIEEEDA